MGTPTYTAVFNWRGAINKKGLYSIHIRVTIAGKSKYHPVALPLKVRTNQWSGKERAWVRESHPFHAEINERIEEKLSRLTELSRRTYKLRRKVSFGSALAELQMGYNTAIFNAYYEEVMKNPPEHLDEGTYGRYYAALGMLNRFNPQIAFHELSEELFKALKKHCQEVEQLASSTTKGYFNAIKKVMDWARLQSHMSKDQVEEALEDVKIKVGKTKKDALEVHEIKAWKECQFDHKHRGYERDRNLFLLQIYTGLYYSDLRTLEKTDLKTDAGYGHYLNADRFKNSNLSIIPLWKFPAAMDLINQYRDEDPDSIYLLRRDAFITDQKFNKRLKTIAALLEWKRNVYNKLGRVTNAQLYIRYGAKLHIVSKILGHEKEESTKYYYEVNVAEVIEGTKDINFEALGIC